MMTAVTEPGPMEGLDSRTAKELLQEYGCNEVPEERPHPVLAFFRKFWGPVPWMLELSLALELFIGRYTQAAVLASLLLFNAVISVIQESRAREALALLRERLTIEVRALRDGQWQLLPAPMLVPGDIVHLRMGDLVPADLELVEGAVSVDQAALTGESNPIEAEAGGKVFAGGVVKRGEATGRVTATGPHSFYGKTAELVHTARTVSHLETTIFGIVKYLGALDALLVAAVMVHALTRGIAWTDFVPFALMLLVASVPVALPAMFTLASALGARELSAHGVLVTHLAAIEEAAAMDTLCSDKTGTLTISQLAVGAIKAYSPFSEDELVRLAALASDEASQDPIDLALLAEAKRRGIPADASLRLAFTPFDPHEKRTEAVVRQDPESLRVTKGFPPVVVALADAGKAAAGDMKVFSEQGHRVIAVAAGAAGEWRLVGLIGLSGPPRPDSAATVQALEDLGVRVLMITGDSRETAQAVATRVGIRGEVCAADILSREAGSKGAAECGVFAEAFPEDKFHLVQALQKAGHVVGMTGDGVNDAPALRQAEVGIAVENATAVAKAAAGVVLINPGLSDALSAVRIGRRIYQRMLTYTLNKIVKTIQIALFLSLGLLLTGVFMTTPRLIVLLLFANDFVTMSLASDRVSFSRRPDRWDPRILILSGLVLAFFWLLFSFAVFYLGREILQLDVPRLQTLVFLMLVFSGQANVYLVRERHYFWSSRPGGWLLLSTVLDIVAVTLLARWGILMTPVAFPLTLGLLGATVVFLFGLDCLKVLLFRHLRIH